MDKLAILEGRLNVIEHELQRAADQRGEIFTPYREPEFVSTVQEIDAEGFITLPNGSKQYVGKHGDGTNTVGPDAQFVGKPPAVPASWQIGDLVRVRGVVSGEPQKITAMNRDEGQVTAKAWDGTEGWKEVSLPWHQWRRVDASGRVLPD